MSLLLRVIIPRCCRLRMCCPAIPTSTSPIITDDASDASRTAASMESTVWLMLLTTPLRTPRDFARPLQMISTFPNSLIRPTMQAIFVVPISRPTMILSSSMISMFFRANDLIFVFEVYGRVPIPGGFIQSFAVQNVQSLQFLFDVPALAEIDEVPPYPGYGNEVAVGLQVRMLQLRFPEWIREGDGRKHSDPFQGVFGTFDQFRDCRAMSDRLGVEVEISGNDRKPQIGGFGNRDEAPLRVEQGRPSVAVQQPYRGLPWLYVNHEFVIDGFVNGHLGNVGLRKQFVFEF